MKQAEKNNRLENNIKHEVKDFHPLLNELFNKMPQFQDVAYTQGNQEFGADFVLKSTEEFGNEIYTGVVVKVGKITQSGLEEVRRQIKECFLKPRLFKNTNQEINIKKVVVITNGTISNNAKVLINSEFNNHLINFIDKDSLIKQIDKFIPEYWEDSRIELNNFFSELEKKCNHILQGGINVKYPNLSYVPIKIEKKQIKDSQIRLSDFKNVKTLQKAIEVSDYVLLEGSMGSGKSALVANFALDIIKKCRSKSDVELIPLVLEFSDYSENIFSEIENEVLSVMEKIKNDIPEPSFLIFLDGFDEYHIEIEKRKSFITDLYKTISNFSNSKFILTTREIDDYEFELFLDKYFTQYSLCGLKNKQIVSIVKSFYEPTTNVKSEISTSELFNMLPKTPMTAILLGQILLHDPKEIPSTMTELYSKFTEMVLFRWNIKDLQSQTEYEVFKNICGIFSHYLLKHSLTTVSLYELKDIIDEYLSQRNLQIPSQTIFNKLSKNNELFIITAKNNTIRFKHRSFCEYFYALHLKQTNKFEISKEIYNPYWQNSYFFLFGLIKDSSTLIEELNQIKFDSYGLKINQVITNSQFLLAAYLSPYDSIKRQVENSIQIASNTVIEILEDPNEEDNLKHMQMGAFELSMFMSIMISEHYNYDFFDNSLKSIADSALSNSDLKSLSDWLKVFFVATTLAEKGDSSYIEILAIQLKDNKVKLDTDKLKALFSIIYHSDFEITENVKIILKAFRKKMPSNPTMSKALNLLLKGKRMEAQKMIENFKG